MNILMEKAVSKISAITRDCNNSKAENRGISPKKFFEMNGKKYMIKGDRNVESFVEVFAYRLCKRIGLNCPPVFFIENKLETKCFGHTKLLSVHLWVDDFITVSDKLDCFDREETHRFGVEAFKMMIFDMIIDNDDRHGNNFGISLNYKHGDQLILIDHGLATPWSSYNGSLVYKSFYAIDSTRSVSILEYMNSSLVEKNDKDELVNFMKVVTSITKDELENMISDIKHYTTGRGQKTVDFVYKRICSLKHILEEIKNLGGEA